MKKEKHTNKFVVRTTYNDAPRRLKVIHTVPRYEIQIQVEQDLHDAYIDISILEAEMLIKTLKSCIDNYYSEANSDFKKR